MSYRKVRDVMTLHVLAVTESTSLREVAATMTSWGVSRLPVLDSSGRLAGMISAADVQSVVRIGAGPRAGRWPGRRDGAPRWGRFQRAASTYRAADLMRAPAAVITPEASVAAAARAMDRAGVRQLPVLDPGGHLAGIVSRGDLVRVFLRSDADIQYEIIQDVFTRYLGTNPALVRVSVMAGLVTLAGEVELKTMIPLAVRMTRSVDGVADVRSTLTFAVDDTWLPVRPGLVST